MLRTEPQLIENFVSAGQVRLAFHHNLDHGTRSEYASMATECAGEQEAGKFWQMHNLLFSRQGSLFGADKSDYDQFAGDLGLDGAAFAACMANDTYLDKVRDMDSERISEWSIRRRPAFVINGRIYEGGIPYTAFEKAIQEALAG